MMVVEVVGRALRAIPEPKVMLELRWEPCGDELEIFWQLDLHAIVAKPGDDHTLFSSVPLYSLPAHTLEQRRETHAIARAIADAAGLSLHAPAVEDEYPRDHATWIAKQPPGPALAHTIGWQVRYWTDAGITESVRGSDIIDETSGRAARHAIYRRLADRFTSRPLTIRLSSEAALTLGASYPAALPPLVQVRELAREHSGRPSPIAHEVVARAPDATPLALMLAFRAAFTPRAELDGYRVLAAWRTGRVDDIVLDDVLTPRIVATRGVWDHASQSRIH